MMPPFGKGTIGQPPMPGGDQNAMMAMMMDNINMSQAMGSAPMMLPPPMLMGGMGPAGAPNPMMMPGAMGPAGPAFMGPRPPPGMPPPPRPPPLTPDAPPPKHPPIPQAPLSAAAPKPVMGPAAPGIRPPSAPPTEPPNKLRRLDGPSGASQAMGPAGAKDMAISNGTAGVRAGSAGPPGQFGLVAVTFRFS
ncbi:hypothetical protein DUNSADRAFT_8416 [Dunaliella salina]|uniref:Uncharacterized protein n=1 Tax=Dunaliella salina TaxID=3046 RepID=A0ABQ7GJM0_DUNSA|nr:hypothetical protein DUNSADRAFT_8416 [Dunaliella salina]|eukprot:KAF5834775.1 hypothetical protein DUNSADRAFT_8416 [Dunaliella salina]